MPEPAGVAVRRIAAGALGRVLRRGAYSNRVLERSGSGLDRRDRALAQRLLYTALRHLTRIDRALQAGSTRPLGAIDPPVLDVLRIAAGELLALETPPHAAVAVGVTVVRSESGERAARFANAVLRRVAEGEEPLPDTPEGRAIRYGVPGWIRRRLAAEWGEEGADGFLAASGDPAPIGVVLRGSAPPPGFVPIPGVPDAGYVADRADAEAAAADGGLVVDPATAAVAAAVAAQPGERILDMAAAPGGKTVLLADALHDRGIIVASDLNASRLRRTRRRVAALGVTPAWVVMDGRTPALRPGSFDAVLLDAPCTGLGTLRRRPEIRHRLRPEDPARMARLQRSLLEKALELIRPGGRVVYSACTVFPEETSGVVAGLPAEPPPGFGGRVQGAGTLLGPDVTGTDGMFISVVGKAP
jgi:16S rRNA (cytosine967-C5)-methyltransferase